MRPRSMHIAVVFLSLGSLTTTGRPEPLSRRQTGGITPPRHSVLDSMKGDVDGDEDIDWDDLSFLHFCLTYSGPEVPLSPVCDIFDFDDDLDVDLWDWLFFSQAFTGQRGSVVVDAGKLLPIVASPDGYYSGEPGNKGNNALTGIARQPGFTQDDLWYEWSLVSKPVGSGDVFITNRALASTAYRIGIPLTSGVYQFELKVTNLITLEFGSDTVALTVRECDDNDDCDDEQLCTIDTCNLITGTCGYELVQCPGESFCDPQTGDCSQFNPDGFRRDGD